MTSIDERARRSRAHLFAGVAALAVGVFGVFVFGWLAGVAMALVAGGNLLAARDVRRHGEVTSTAIALIVVGGVGFVVVLVPILLVIFSR